MFVIQPHMCVELFWLVICADFAPDSDQNTDYGLSF